MKKQSNVFFFFAVASLVGVSVWLLLKRKNQADTAISDLNTNSTDVANKTIEEQTSVSVSNSSTSLKKGDIVTVNSGVNLRSTDKSTGYKVLRKTTSVERDWKLYNDPYRNTISGIAGTWVVIYKSTGGFLGLNELFMYYVVNINLIKKQ